MLAQAMRRTTTCHREQQDDGRFRFFMDGALAAPARRKEDLFRLEALHRPGAHLLLERRFHIGDDGMIDGIDGDGRFLDGCSRLEASETDRPSNSGDPPSA